MYTEIKEAVAFLFRFYRSSSPRRRVALLMEEFANQLIAKCFNSWDINDPNKGEEHRMIDLFHKEGDNCVVDKLFFAAAKNLYIEEVLGKTPEIKLYINPGMVYYTCNKNSSPVIIWSGDVNADDNYNPLPVGTIHKHQKSRSVLATGKSVFLSGDAKNVGFSFNFPEVDDPNPLILRLVDCHPLVDPSPLDLTLKKFEFNSKDHKPTNVAQFAKTRFGSNKSRPDHDYMRRLQCLAANQAYPQAFQSFHSGGTNEYEHDSLMRTFSKLNCDSSSSLSGFN